MSANAIETLRALYERVEMDESAGICLSSRVEALNFPGALAAVEALLQASDTVTNGTTATMYARENVEAGIPLEPVYIESDALVALAAAVRRVETGQ